jgi:uncharacterized protein YoxC
MSLALAAFDFTALVQNGAQATAQDTALMRIVGAAPSLLDHARSVSVTLMIVAVVGFVVALIPAVWSLRKTHRRVGDLIDRLQSDVTPVMRHATTIADNLNYITTSLRADVEHVHRVVSATHERMDDAVRAVEVRAKEFDALLSVAQEEAEDAFVATAAAVRGVRAGASAFARRARTRDAQTPAHHEDIESGTDHVGSETSDGEIHTTGRGDADPKPRICRHTRRRRP